jgi:glycosyltransferase involved in cell wall biosynthesis
MKICFLLADISHTGGIERMTSTLAAEMLKERKDIQIDIVSQFHSSQKLWFPFDGCNIVFLSHRNFDAKPHSIDRAFRIFANIKRVRSYFKTNKYDFILAQSLSNVFILYFAGISLKNVFAIEQIHYNYYGTLIKRIRLHIYKKALKVVVLSKNAKSFFDKHLPQEHTVVIPNPIDICNGEKASLDGKEAIAVGRLEYQKGFDTLIDIFAEVHQIHPEWKLNIYGDGNLHEQLTRQIKETKLEGIVNLKGRTDNVPHVMQESAFFILSSRCEGFGIVLTEAMQQGLPCVSFDCPDGPSDIISNYEDGIVVPNQDKQALKEAICYMIEHPKERKTMGKKASDNINRYSVDNICKIWLKLLDENSSSLNII